MGINENLEEIKELLKDEKKEKEKKWKLPWKAKTSKSKAKKGYIGVLKLNENRTITPSKERIEEQTIIVDGVPRLSTAEYVWYLGKHPVILLPSWSVKPISPNEKVETNEPLNPSELYQNSMNDGSNIKGYKLLMNKMKLSTIDAKKQMGGILKWIIGLVLAGIIVYAIMTGGG